MLDMSRRIKKIQTLRTLVLSTWIAAAFTCGFTTLGAADCRPAEEPLTRAMGAWRALDGSPVLVVEPYRLLVQEENRLSVLPLRDVGEDRILVVHDDRQLFLPFVVNGLILRTTHEPNAEVEPFQLIEEDLPELSFEPLELGEMRSLPEEQVQRIQAQIDERMERDQTALKKKLQQTAEPGEVERITVSNTAYLVELVQDVGWIDQKRFGLKTAHRAVILAQHSDYVPLALAALPYIEEDFKHAVDSPETYPVFVDWLRLELGECQRYGSRIERDPSGAPVLAPLEDEEAVDDLRAEQGMSPLQEYLDLAGKHLFGGQEIQRPGS